MKNEKTAEQIENNFKSHGVTAEQSEQMQQIREKAKRLAEMVNDFCPDSREKSLSLTHAEEVMFWANASIARQNKS